MSDRVEIAKPFKQRSWERGLWALQPALERHERQDNKVVRWIEESAALLMSQFRLPRRRLRKFARAVVAQGAELEALDGSELAQQIAELRRQLRATPDQTALIIRAFALIREMTHRKLYMRHYPSQLMAGYVLHKGAVAQLATGEGKTITGLLPAITAALSGLPVHIVTVNPYLAERDCATLRPVIEAFGLSVGLIETDMQPDDKRQIYACDVVFVTNKDLCFDYLRDIGARGEGQSHARRLLGQVGKAGAQARVQPMMRGLHFALLDEVDLVLIDEARIPLIISGPRDGVEDETEFRRAMDFADELTEPQHFKVDRARRSAELTEAGKVQVKHLAQGATGLWRAERARVERVEQALAARHVYARGHDYVVMEDDTVQIVDPHTGRVTPGRSWERGLHQLIELKEGVPLTGRSNTTAKITYQRFFRRYMKLSGMTGTAQGLGLEFWRVFGLRIHHIPTHRPNQRIDRRPRIYREGADRWDAVVDRAMAVKETGGAVLVGTLSVESSDLVAQRLQAEGAAPLVLNALQDAEEARIVAAAGGTGTITIATSMAGRGTDISLDPKTKTSGGLHVLVSEPSESRRVDFQLMGRAGRQGDPGQTETLLSLDDTLFQTYAPVLTKHMKTLMKTLGLRTFRGPFAALLLAGAQRNVERRNGRLRKATLKSDRDIIKMLGFAGRGE